MKCFQNISQKFCKKSLRPTYKDNLKIDRSADMNWIKLALDRAQWRALIEKIRILRLPRRWGTSVPTELVHSKCLSLLMCPRQNARVRKGGVRVVTHTVELLEWSAKMCANENLLESVHRKLFRDFPVQNDIVTCISDYKRSVDW
jgi:DNA primase large subunit